MVKSITKETQKMLMTLAERYVAECDSNPATLGERATEVWAQIDDYRIKSERHGDFRVVSSAGAKRENKYPEQVLLCEFLAKRMHGVKMPILADDTQVTRK